MSDAVIGADDSSDNVIVNRWILATLTAISGTLVGLAPVIIVTKRAHLLPYFFGGMVLLAVSHFVFSRFSGSKVQPSATYRPVLMEILLAGLSTVSAWALSGLTWFICYWIVRLLLKLSAYLFGNFEYERIAFWGTLVFAVLLGIGVFIASLDEMVTKLYPKTHGVRSAFYDLAVRRRRWLVAYIVIGVAIPALVALGSYLTAGALGSWFFIFLQVYLFFATSGLSAGAPPGQLTKESSAPAVEAVSKLLTNLGYKIMPQPKIGDKELDPFLINLDLLAFDGERALAIEIKTQKESPEPVEWTVASSLRMTALAIGPELEKLGINTAALKLFLVLNDRTPAPSLVGFSNNLRETPSQGEIHIAEIPSVKIDEILATDDQATLRNIARDVGLLVGDMNSTPEAAEGGERP